MVLDYDVRLLWAEFDDGVQQIASPKFPFIGDQPITGISIYQDERGSLGLDIDDVVVTTTATPVIKPAKGGNTGEVTISLHNFFELQAGTSVRLTAPGLPDIIGKDTTVVNTILTRTTFDLAGSPPGVRDIVVTNANGNVLTFRNSFTVEAGGVANVSLRKAGTTVVPGRTVTYYVVAENTGNVDAKAVEVLEFVDPEHFTLISTDPAPVVDMAAIIDASQIPWLIPRIAPNQSIVLRTYLKIESTLV